MDKPLYKITQTLDYEGNIAEDAKHRLNRTGYILKLTKGMGLRFLYEETEKMLKSSIVKDIVRRGNTITVYTLNTIYKLEEIEV